MGVIDIHCFKWKYGDRWPERTIYW